MSKEYLDGTLFMFCNVNEIFVKLQQSPIIDLSIVQNMENCRDFIRKVVFNSRENGLNWIFSEEDIWEEDGEKTWKYRLPSVDLSTYLDIENNNKVPQLFKKNGFNKDRGDTEHGAWYPAFKTKKDAIECIKLVNKLFDLHYLKKEY